MQGGLKELKNNTKDIKKYRIKDARETREITRKSLFLVSFRVFRGLNPIAAYFWFLVLLKKRRALVHSKAGFQKFPLGWTQRL